jgi:hypothetical protein
VLACPPVADRIALAEMCGDEKFFVGLRNALKGPSKKHWVALEKMRYAMFALREFGIAQLSDRELEDLFIHQLRVYPNTASGVKNLRAQYRKHMAHATL